MAIEARLTTDSLTDIPLQERCITAWVSDMKPPPYPDNPLGRLTQCLGDDPTVLFESGQIGVMNVAFPCVGVSPITYPCRDEDGTPGVDNGLEPFASAAVWSDTGEQPYARMNSQVLRAQDVGRFDTGEIASGKSAKVILLPENNVIIQVKDPEGRIIDTQSHSVTSGNAPSWQTAREPDSRSGDREVGGVTITYSRAVLNDQITDWSSLVRGASVAGLHGSSAPGLVRVRPPGSGSVFLDLNPNAVRSALTLSSPSDRVIPFFIEFENLGSYVFDWITTLDRTDTTETPNSYTATARYTFHVGPIAELAVRDGGASPHVPADRSALTIVAVNNGPDSSLGARVTGLPIDAEVLHISQGDYYPSTGVWDIGEIKEPEHYRAGGGLPEPTLVLGATADPTARVTIENSVDYEVCIGSDASTLAHTTEAACEAVTGASWHTTPVYDYDTSNNTDVTITAARGTGGVGPGVPSGSRTTTGHHRRDVGPRPVPVRSSGGALRGPAAGRQQLDLVGRRGDRERVCGHRSQRGARLPGAGGERYGREAAPGPGAPPWCRQVRPARH